MNSTFNIRLNADEIGDDTEFRREWLVANGIGGYASSSVAGANTRRYHGLLVAALDPPVARAVVLSKLEESLTLTPLRDLSHAGEESGAGVQRPEMPPAEQDATSKGKISGASSDPWPPAPDSSTYDLSVNLYPDVTYPTGNQWLTAWQDTPAPTWTWSPEPGLTFEKQIWMLPGSNTVYVAYRLLACPDGFAASLTLVPLLAWKDYHSEMRAVEPAVSAVWENRILRVALPGIVGAGLTPQTLAIQPVRDDGKPYPDATFTPGRGWYYRFQHPRERERGQDSQEDLYAPGAFTAPLTVGVPFVMVASVVERDGKTDNGGNAETASVTLSSPSEALQAFTTRYAPDEEEDETESDTDAQIENPKSEIENQLTRAAQQFLIAAPGVRSTIIAGYPWFSDWGRDTMIALPGLCLTTGQTDIARDILTAFSRFVDGGMIPNRFPDAGTAPEYNTVDATLWYVNAIHHYVAATGDIATLRDTLWPVLKTIVDAHRQGTRYNIHVDTADNLLFAGQNGVQLTWMDAKVGDWVVTPRIGKPVEVNALWHNALRCMANWAEMLGETDAQREYSELSDAVRASFLARFPSPNGQGLYDVLDTPEGGPDASVRPNQVFALSLPYAPLEPSDPVAPSIVEAVREELLTPVGLRTLSPRDPRYRPRYEGDGMNRDGAYHQGTVWPWLLGAFAEAYHKINGDVSAALDVLSPLESQLSVYGMGSLPEIYDGDAPHRANGCVAQAWSVGETLRVWHFLAASPSV